MKIELASFALVEEHLYEAHTHFHPEKVILILSNEDLEEANEKSKEIKEKINEITDFYLKLKIPLEKVYINYKNFMETTIKLAQIIQTFNENDEILLNLSGGRRSIPIAMIYASSIVSNFQALNIQCVVIPLDRTYKPFYLLPNYIPDETDVKLMSKLNENSTLKELEKFLQIKQPTISIRLKKLEKFGYVILKGRRRELTPIGKLVADINEKYSK